MKNFFPLIKVLLIFLFMWSLQVTARYDCKIFLTARDCSSCLYMAAAIEQLPYFIRPDVYVDGNLDSTEFDYFIDTLLNLDRKRYNFHQTKKEFTTSNTNVLYFLNNTGKAVFKCRLAEIPVYIDSIRQHFTDFYEVKTIPIKKISPLLSKAKISKIDNNILIFNTKLHELTVINDSLQYTIRTKDLPLDSVLTILTGDTSAIRDIKKAYEDPNVYFPPVEMADYWCDNGYLYVLYSFYKPTVEKDPKSSVSNIQFIPVYFTVQYVNGNLVNIFRIKQKGFAEIDDEKSWPLSYFGKYCFMVKKDKMYLTVDNPEPMKQKYYLCELKLNKQKHIFEFSKKIATGISPLVKTVDKDSGIYPSYLNWSFVSDNKLWFMSQNVYYDFKKCAWSYYTFHLPEITADTARIFKHFVVYGFDGYINNKYPVVTILPSGPNNRSSNFYTTIFDENMKQVEYYNTYNFMICNKSSAYVEGDRIYVIEQDKMLHVYAIKHGLN